MTCFKFFLLLSENSEHKAQPFDFLVDGELVRMPLDQFLLAKGISAVFIFFKSLFLSFGFSIS